MGYVRTRNWFISSECLIRFHLIMIGRVVKIAQCIGVNFYYLIAFYFSGRNVYFMSIVKRAFSSLAS